MVSGSSHPSRTRSGSVGVMYSPSSGGAEGPSSAGHLWVLRSVGVTDFIGVPDSIELPDSRHRRPGGPVGAPNGVVPPGGGFAVVPVRGCATVPPPWRAVLPQWWRASRHGGTSRLRRERGGRGPRQGPRLRRAVGRPGRGGDVAGRCRSIPADRPCPSPDAGHRCCGPSGRAGPRAAHPGLGGQAELAGARGPGGQVLLPHRFPAGDPDEQRHRRGRRLRGER